MSDFQISGNEVDRVYVVMGQSGSVSNFDLKTMDSGATTNGFVIVPGGGTSSWFPTAATGQDVNGDGYSDIIIGDQNGDSDGFVYIIYGHTGTAGSSAWSNLRAEGSSGVFNAANTSVSSTLIKASGSGNGDADLGDSALSSLGDVNGDGYNDFIILAPRADSSGGTGDTGAAWIVFGSPTDATTTSIDLTTRVTAGKAVRLDGVQSGEWLGSSTLNSSTGKGSNNDAIWGQSRTVNNIGDINGDGISDIAIGSPDWGDSNGDNAAEGRVYIVYGKSTGWASMSLSTLNGSNGFILTRPLGSWETSSSSDTQLGGSISNGGDINGDGIDDFIVSAPGADASSSSTDNGSAYVIFGSAGGVNFSASTDIENLVTSGKAIKYSGKNADEWLGSSMALGDFNGDGISEYVIGAWETDATVSGSNVTDTGALKVYSGITDNLTQTATSGADNIIAGTNPLIPIVNGVDRIAAGQGNDIIQGIGTDTTGNSNSSTLHDVAYGGTGNDQIGLIGTNFTRIDGGLGFDTLKFETTGLSLDFTQFGNKIQGFESIDMGASNTLKISLADVLTQPDTLSLGQHFTLKGTSGTVDLHEAIDSNHWSTASTAQVSGIDYNVYHYKDMNAEVDLYIQTSLTVI